MSPYRTGEIAPARGQVWVSPSGKRIELGERVEGGTWTFSGWSYSGFSGETGDYGFIESLDGYTLESVPTGSKE